MRLPVTFLFVCCSPLFVLPLKKPAGFVTMFLQGEAL